MGGSPVTNSGDAEMVLSIADTGVTLTQAFIYWAIYILTSYKTIFKAAVGMRPVLKVSSSMCRNKTEHLCTVVSSVFKVLHIVCLVILTTAL